MDCWEDNENDDANDYFSEINKTLAEEMLKSF